MKHAYILTLFFISSLGFGQETIDEMFDDGIVHGYRINPSVDIVKLIIGTPNINIELFPTEKLSFTAGAGITPFYRIRSMGELIDGDSLIETGIKLGTYLHFKAKLFYYETNKAKVYFGIIHNRSKNNLKEVDVLYTSKYYTYNQLHFGSGLQWQGAHNITIDYFLGVGFTGKKTYGNNTIIGNKLIDDDEFGGFLLSFKIGYPLK